MIAAALTDVGAARSIVIDERNEVLAGNGVLAGAAQAGLTKLQIVDADGETIIAVRRRGLTDAQKRALAIFDNRAAELAEWNVAQLAADLTNGEDLTAFFSADELQALLSDGKAKPGKTDPDTIPNERPTGIVGGDLFELGGHRLLCGDSTTQADVARLCGNVRAALMNTDPPYLVDYDGSNHPQSTANSAMTKDKRWDAYKDPAASVRFYSEFIAVAYATALLERAPMYQWYADRRGGIVFDAWETNGLLVHQAVCWVKSRPVLTHSHLMWQHEPALYGWKQGKQAEPERRPPANETTVWQIDKQGSENDVHPTEKPVELFTRPIAWHTRTGEACYEPFSGSGSQLIAAEQLGRRCLAMEIEPTYVQVAIDRWEAFTGLKATKVGEPVRLRKNAKRAK